MSDTFKTAPEDIKELAKHIVASFGSDEALLVGAIAAALDSERSMTYERSAFVAECHVVLDWSAPPGKRADDTYGKQIAYAIRARARS